MNINHERGMILIWFCLLITILLITSSAIYGLSFQESKLVEIDKFRNQAFYLAEAGLDKKLQQIRAGDLTNISSTSFSGGTYATTYDAAAKMITATGTYNNVTRVVKAKVTKTLPPGVKGAITAAGDAAFNGSIVVDGRDHDSSGTVTGAGTYGISSGGTVNQGGSSTIGGNGFAPADPANPAAIEQNASGATTNPEAAIGVAAGTFDAYKTSTIPSLPMSGIVYYTGDEWIAPDFGDATNPSTGILIVHNSTGTALLKNIHGSFNGLIIADDLIHINGDAVVNGGVILQKSTGNTIGNGNAHVNYSSTVLSDLPAGDYDIVAWEDTNNTAYTYS